MARHEFGIMQNAPEPRKRYDEYEPQKYNCMSVDDDYIEKIVANLSNIDFYWHSLDMPAKGIAYTGITLVPPTSLVLKLTALCPVFLNKKQKIL